MQTRVLVLVQLLIASLALPLPLAAQETERQILSGTGYRDSVDWGFTVTDGRRAGEATTIPVPSQWEQHGFGGYNYGHDKKKHKEQGLYRHRFEVPDGWRDRVIDLVFEGVMTDAEVRLNGELAGPVHRGAFYRFRYDVSDKLRFEGENLLEVTVRKHSSDRSVNRAERDADYWVFGGIFRPVYLEARPLESIDHVAIDARHDGSLAMRVTPRGVVTPAVIKVAVETLEGTTVCEATADVAAQQEVVDLAATCPGAHPWSAEKPVLHRAVVELLRAGQVLHRHVERFGFRTVEVRSEGLFVNGRRLLLKGVNRHAFWPSSGRTLDRDLDRRDAELIKSMNMNAVRTSHYPPDKSFLEACDEIGLYVIDELAGWHDAYGTRVGRQLVGEMVRRDVNHPSVIFWANGNEDGWNTSLDSVFGEHDPQGRIVLHPRSVFNGFDTFHYPSWAELEGALDPESRSNRWRALWGELPLYLPTEILHGLYDGGSGAGLEDFWQRIRLHPRAAGMFLWVFSDEAIERTDRNGELDTDGNHAPDGVLGPYRELSANFYAVREIFAPIQLETQRFAGSVGLENRFDETDLSECRFDWRLLRRSGAGALDDPEELASGTLPGPSIAPGERGELRWPREIDWRPADTLHLIARDPDGRVVWAHELPTRDLRQDAARRATMAVGSIEVQEADGQLSLRAAQTRVRFDLATGELLELAVGDAVIPLWGGPRLLGSESSVQRSSSPSVHRRRGASYVVETAHESGLVTRWTLFPSGWLRLAFSYPANGPMSLSGAYFEADQDSFESFRWFGGGPARVWKNRIPGAALGAWSKGMVSTPDEAAHEPKLEGFYAGIYWAELATQDAKLTISFESPDLFLGLFSPGFPDEPKYARIEAPPGGISFLHAIPGIGTKFKSAAELGPASRPEVTSGTYHGMVWLRAEPRSVPSPSP